MELNTEFEATGGERTPSRLLEYFAQAPDALMVVDPSDKIILLNARAEHLFECESKQLEGNRPRDLFPEWDTSLSMAVLHNPIDGENVYNMPALRHNGEKFSAEVSLSLVVIAEHSFVVAGIRDITPNGVARRELECVNKELIETNQRLTSLSTTDPLTQLLNRRGFETVLTREISYAKRKEVELIAVLVDLDDFKSINDKNGHAVGDRVLVQVSKVLSEGLRTVDWIARVGGDEFLILLTNTTLALAAMVADRIRVSLSQSAIPGLNDRSTVTASFGLVSVPTHLSTLEDVLQLTTATLKASKQGGKNRVTSTQSELLPAPSESLILRCALNGTAASHIVAQPIFKLLTTAEIDAYEFFFRGPAGPLEAPDEFFRAAEFNDMLTLADINSFSLCLKRAKEMANDRTKNINIFPSTLLDVPTRKLIELINRSEIKSKICLELSERRFFTDPACLKNQVRELRANGIMICLDDFGYGHTTIESLLIMEPTYVKIDKDCINGVAHDADKRRCSKQASKTDEVDWCDLHSNRH
ncbi:MAG: diguanylate cyclase [Candidatus Melainabacteria bacterium]|nr:diguanylate cyclase [Candidatus Melainabacteria bacterium]